MKTKGSLILAFAAAWFAPLAHADLQLSYKVGGGAATACDTISSTNPNQTGICSTITSGTVSITGFEGSGSQVVGQSQEFGATLKLTNTSSSAVTVTLWLADSDFSEPVTPPNILYSSSVSLTSTIGTGSVGLTSCVDTSNGLAPPTSTFCATPAASITNTSLSYGPGPSSANNTESATITSLSAPYSLSQEITVTLGAGSSMNVDTSQILTTVPEPMSVAMLGVVLLLASKSLRRKRNQESIRS